MLQWHSFRKFIFANNRAKNTPNKYLNIQIFFGSEATQQPETGMLMLQTPIKRKIPMAEWHAGDDFSYEQKALNPWNDRGVSLLTTVRLLPALETIGLTATAPEQPPKTLHRRGFINGVSYAVGGDARDKTPMAVKVYKPEDLLTSCVNKAASIHQQQRGRLEPSRHRQLWESLSIRARHRTGDNPLQWWLIRSRRGILETWKYFSRPYYCLASLEAGLRQILGAKPVSIKIDKSNYAEEWPFKKGFDSGTLICVPGIEPYIKTGSGKKYSYIVFTPDAEPNKKYALNGTAMNVVRKEGFSNAERIRTREYYGYGVVGLGDVTSIIDQRLKLCDHLNWLQNRLGFRSNPQPLFVVSSSGVVHFWRQLFWENSIHHDYKSKYWRLPSYRANHSRQKTLWTGKRNMQIIQTQILINKGEGN